MLKTAVASDVTAGRHARDVGDESKSAAALN
jgi:hypothetical protein